MILLAGPSGSGKSHLAETAGCPRLVLDDFYFDADHPDLPRTLGIVDWDDVRSWDADAALAAIISLCATGIARVPIYDISKSRRTGTQELDLGPARAFVAEGVFAPDIVASCEAAGVTVDALYLDRPRTLSLILRFVRDLREHRKSVWVLIRRGLALWRSEPAIRRHALASGCRPVSKSEAMSVLKHGI